MAKFKLKKLPKKPKASASNATLENYLKRVAEVKAHNARITADKKRHETLRKRVASITASDVQPGARSSVSAPRKRKSTAGKKKAAKKSKRKR